MRVSALRSEATIGVFAFGNGAQEVHRLRQVS